MKYLLINILLIFLSFNSFAQDCSELITIEKDKFTGDITGYTKIGNSVSFWKFIKNGKATYYLSLKVPGNTLNVGEKGAFLILNDSIKINFPNEPIDVKADTYNWAYTAFIEIGPKTREKLLKYPITDIRLYIYDIEIGKGDGGFYIDSLKCLINQ